MVSHPADPPALVAYFEEQARYAPGADPCLAAFYGALAKLLTWNADAQRLVAELNARRPLPLAYLGNLLFRAVQYLKLFHWREPAYLAFTTDAQWERDLAADLCGPARWQALLHVLLTRDTQTTKYQRYAGVHAVLAARWPDQAVAVADFGCGANLGLPGIAHARPFAPIADATPDALVTRLLRRVVCLADALAIDRHHPATSDATAWYIACSYYPSELLADRDLLSRVASGGSARPIESPDVAFAQLDLLSPSAATTISAARFDAVVLSTVLYQHPPDARWRLLALARKAVRPDGMIVVQDFLAVEAEELRFLDTWFDGANYVTAIASEQTGWRFAEVLRWNNGRCRAVTAGRDAHILRAATSGAHTAAATEG